MDVEHWLFSSLFVRAGKYHLSLFAGVGVGTCGEGGWWAGHAVGS
jgi:hypothetical protein